MNMCAYQFRCENVGFAFIKKMWSDRVITALGEKKSFKNKKNAVTFLFYAKLYVVIFQICWRTNSSR